MKKEKMNQTQSKSKSRHGRQLRAKTVVVQKPKILGWSTTDNDEIALRRWRGEIEPMSVQALEAAHPMLSSDDYLKPDCCPGIRNYNRCMANRIP